MTQANVMRDDAKWIEAVQGLIALTRVGKIDWTSIDPASIDVFGSGVRILSAYEARYGDQKMRILEEGYSPREKRDFLSPMGSIFTPTQPAGNNIITTRVSLRLIDVYGGTTFVFPQVEGLGDLLAAVKAQQANIEGFLDTIKQAVA